MGKWVSLPGVKHLGRGVDHPYPSTTEVKEREKLYLCFPSGPSMRVLGLKFTFIFIFTTGFNYHLVGAIIATDRRPS